MMTTQSDDDSEGTVDDQFRSLMEGLRTSLPAVQVLFAFLLIAPLQTEFADFSVGEQAPYSGLTRRSKEHLIWSTWITIVGSILMAAAVLATVYLVSSLVFDGLVAAIATVVMATVVGWAWFFLPLVTYRS